MTRALAEGALAHVVLANLDVPAAFVSDGREAPQLKEPAPVRTAAAAGAIQPEADAPLDSRILEGTRSWRRRVPGTAALVLTSGSFAFVQCKPDQVTAPSGAPPLGLT